MKGTIYYTNNIERSDYLIKKINLIVLKQKLSQKKKNNGKNYSLFNRL